MEYKYLFEDNANKNELIIENIDVLNILCYHIEANCKYPFIQFMMEKIPFCNNIIQEQLILPYIFFRTQEKSDISLLVLTKIKQCLEILKCDHTNVNENMYKGLVFDQNSFPYALVNISDIDIYGLNFNRQTTTWFGLPSEIINVGKILNVEVESDLICLFKSFPDLGLLTNPTTGQNYIIPDIVYTGDNKIQAQFKSIFNNTKSNAYDSCGSYYYFYRSIADASNGNEYINRYALFVEGNICLDDFSLTDNDIENLYPDPCIIIGNPCMDNKPNILVKNYESFVCLSYVSLS